MNCMNSCPFKGRIYVPPIDKKANILIIGESPGETEEKEGIPFVGKAGKLLREMVEIYLHDESISYANSACCRIDKEKDSTKTINEALKLCKMNLINTIEKVNPRLLILCGAIAVKQVLGLKGNISNYRGRLFYSDEFKLNTFVMWHPSFIVRNMQHKFPYVKEELMSYIERTYIYDWKYIKEFVSNGYENIFNKTNYEEAIYKSQLDKYRNAKIVAIDIETSSSDLFDKSTKILSIGLSCEEGYATVVTKPELIEEAIDIICDENKIKILAGRPFDEHAIYLKYNKIMEGKKFDIFTLAHLLDENYVINLENVANRYAKGMRNIKDIIGDYRTHMHDCPHDKLVEYQATDADATWRSFNGIKESMSKDLVLKRYYYYFISKVQDMFSEISLHGIKINKNKLLENEQKLVKLRDKYVKKAISFLPREIKNKYKYNLDLNRNIISVDYLFESPEGLNLKPIFRTPKTGQPQITEEHLSYFNHPYIKCLLEKKKIDKILNTYVKRLWQSIKYDGKIYPQTTLTRTVTGRTVMLNPEIQTYPKRGKYASLIREVIEADDGWLFGARDLSQSELRIMGWLAQDENILNALKNKEDLHERTAKLILGLSKITPKDRQSAKAVNFGFIYGMQASTFQRYARMEYDIEIPLSKCQLFRDRFFAKPDGYWKVELYHNYITNELQDKGYVISPLGRKRRLPSIYSPDVKIRNEAIRQAINTRIQSFSSDLGLIGMLLFYEELKNKNMLDRIMPLWFIHDEIIFKAKEDYIEEAHKLLKECMEERAKEYIKKHWKFEVGYPIETEGKYGKNWGNLQKGDI